MFKRVILYLPSIIIIGCADDMDDQIMKQDLNDDELVESNDSLLVTTQVKDEVDEPIPPKTPHSAALGLKFVQAAKTKVLPKSETLEVLVIPSIVTLTWLFMPSKTKKTSCH